MRPNAQDICSHTVKNGRRHRAVNPWRTDDFKTLQFLARGELSIQGFRNRDLRRWLHPDIDASDSLAVCRASGRITRRIQIFRAHGIIKKIPHTTRYSLTKKRRKIVNAILAASSVDTEQLMEMAA